MGAYLLAKQAIDNNEGIFIHQMARIFRQIKKSFLLLMFLDSKQVIYEPPTGHIIQQLSKTDYE